MAKCAKCGAKLGFLGGNSGNWGKSYCDKCFATLTAKDLYYCEQCAYYRPLNSYEGECKRDYDKNVGYKKSACGKFSKR